MSHVQDLYRQEALGFISSREFDRRFDDAVEQDMIDSWAKRDLDAEYEAYCSQAYEEYIQDILNSMTPHERKHSLNPNRMDLKGGHRHNHIFNVCYRLTSRGKNSRRIPQQDKKFFIKVFWENLHYYPFGLYTYLSMSRKRK